METTIMGPDGHRVPISDDGDIDLDETALHLDDGTRITEAMAERWADEAEAANLARRGRPSLSAPTRHSPRWDVRVPEAWVPLAEARMKADHVNRSELLRRALRQYLGAA